MRVCLLEPPFAYGNAFCVLEPRFDYWNLVLTIRTCYSLSEMLHQNENQNLIQSQTENEKLETNTNKLAIRNNIYI